MFLEAHFGEVELHMPETMEEEPELQEEAHQDPSLLVQLDDADAEINLVTLVRSYHVSSACGSSSLFFCSGCDQFKRNLEKACRRCSGYGSHNCKFIIGIVHFWGTCGH